MMDSKPPYVLFQLEYKNNLMLIGSITTYIGSVYILI